MAFHARVMSIRAPWSFEVIADLLAEYGEVHVSLKERSGLRSCAPSERPCLPKVLLLLSHLLHPSRATGEVDFSTAYPACQHMAHRADRRWSGVFTGSSSPLQRGMSASSLAPQASRLADRRSAVSLVPSQGTGDRGPTQAWNIYKHASKESGGSFPLWREKTTRPSFHSASSSKYDSKDSCYRSRSPMSPVSFLFWVDQVQPTWDEPREFGQVDSRETGDSSLEPRRHSNTAQG